MKNNFKIIGFLLLIFQSFAGFTQEFNFVIKGQIKGLKNDTLLLQYFDHATKGNKTLKVAGKEDQFSVSGKALKPSIVFASIDKRRKDGNFTFFIDKGLIQINGDSKAIEDVKVSGTEINDDFSRGNAVTHAFYQRRNQLYKLGQEITDKQSDAYKALSLKVAANADSLYHFRITHIKQYPASMFSAIQLYLLTDKLPVDLLDSLYRSLKSPAKDMTYLERLPAIIVAKKASQIGSQAPLFTLKDSKGKLVNLSDYKGKYVLLDFWASWCVPCRKENPELVAAYNKFSGHPFEIISVSSDENEEKWRKAILEDGLEKWVHIADLKGIQNEIALKYGVQPIPDNFLIDPTGKIIARGLRGNEVDKKLTAIFSK